MLSTLPFSVKLVLSKPGYIALVVIVTIPICILFSMFDQLLFFEPILIFYLPEDAIVGFILTCMVSILLGILFSMNVYVIRHSKMRISKG